MSSSPARRTTRQRAALAGLLGETTQFRSAQDLHVRLRDAGDPVSLATVYRNLQAMVSDGEVDLVRTADGEALYRACDLDQHHHHLVCRACGRTVEVQGPAVFEAWSEAVSTTHGFRDVTHTLEIFGLCAGCPDDEAAPG